MYSIISSALASSRVRAASSLSRRSGRCEITVIPRTWIRNSVVQRVSGRSGFAVDFELDLSRRFVDHAPRTGAVVAYPVALSIKPCPSARVARNHLAAATAPAFGRVRSTASGEWARHWRPRYGRGCERFCWCRFSHYAPRWSARRRSVLRRLHQGPLPMAPAVLQALHSSVVASEGSYATA
jgi:hypothetical protein